MKLGQALKMAVRSIGASKTRTALTMLGIIIGVASVVILVSVVQGSNKKQMEYFEKMGNNKISVNIYSSMVFMETGDGASIAVSSGPVKDGSVPQKRIAKIICSLAMKGNQSRTTDFAELNQGFRTTYGYFLSKGKWDEQAVSRNQQDRSFQKAAELAQEKQVPLYLSIDDTVIEKKRPSSRSKRPISKFQLFWPCPFLLPAVEKEEPRPGFDSAFLEILNGKLLPFAEFCNFALDKYPGGVYTQNTQGGVYGRKKGAAQWKIRRRQKSVRKRKCAV